MPATNPMEVLDLPDCEISGRPRWKVAGQYHVVRDYRGQHLVTDEKTGVEYHIGWSMANKPPLIEYTVWSKRGRRKMAYAEISSVRLLRDNGPRHKQICEIIDAIKN